MSFYYEPKHDETELDYQRRMESEDAWAHRRAQLEREEACMPWWAEVDKTEIVCAPETIYCPLVMDEEVGPNPFDALVSEAGLTEAEASALSRLIARKPARVERLQMNLFPEVA